MDQRSVQRAAWMLLAVVAAGCGTDKSMQYASHTDLQHYRAQATRIDFPAVDEPLEPAAAITDVPRTLLTRRRDELWDMPLSEALHIALENNKIIRTDGQFLVPGNPLYTNPAFPSIYDPAIQQSGFLFGNRGVEAALSDFDAQFTTNMIWGRDERVQNSLFGLGGFAPLDLNGPVFAPGGLPGNVLVQETALFRSRLEKQMAHGGLFAINKDWNYLWSNAPGQLFPSTYTGSLEAEYRHPLWAGAGTEFTRIAGPTPPGFRAIVGVSQGVVIARINEDIAIADFEMTVHNLLRDVENLYWDLYLAYRRYDAAITARNSALRTWRDERIRMDIGAGNPADEAQARDAYFATRAQAEQTLADIYTTEVRFRRLLGLPVNDCRVIRPCDDPVQAEFDPDWCFSLAEALTRRVELRRQKWNIKSLELQLQAARSLTNPRFDFVSAYRVNAFGDKLIDFHNGDDPVTGLPYRSAWHTLRRGDQTGWNLGFEFSMPIGFRLAHAQVRNIELRLVKARALLAAQELEISHELATAYQNLAAAWVTARTNFNRLPAARELVRLTQERLEVGEATIDLLLRNQVGLADAEVAYYTSLVNYNQALNDLQFRKGTILEHNNVHLAEGPWTPDAYREALRRAWARTNALPAPMLHTEPEEFALPGGLDDPLVFPEHGLLPGAWPGPPGGAVLEPAPGPVPLTPDDSLRPLDGDGGDAVPHEDDVPDAPDPFGGPLPDDPRLHIGGS